MHIYIYKYTYIYTPFFIFLDMSNKLLYISSCNNKSKLQLKQKSLTQLRNIKGNISESCRSFIIPCICDCFLESGDKCLYAVYGRGHIHMLVLEVKEFRFCIRFPRLVRVQIIVSCQGQLFS